MLFLIFNYLYNCINEVQRLMWWMSACPACQAMPCQTGVVQTGLPRVCRRARRPIANTYLRPVLLQTTYTLSRNSCPGVGRCLQFLVRVLPFVMIYVQRPMSMTNLKFQLLQFELQNKK